MVYGCILNKGVGGLSFIGTIMDSHQYLNIFKDKFKKKRK